MSYQQCTRFRTTLDFDREYLWNESSNRQAVNGVMNYDFSHVRRKQLGELRPLTKTWPWSLTLKFNWVLSVVEVHVHAKFRQATCSGSWVIVVTLKLRDRWLAVAGRTEGWWRRSLLQSSSPDHQLQPVPAPLAACTAPVTLLWSQATEHQIGPASHLSLSHRQPHSPVSRHDQLDQVK